MLDLDADLTGDATTTLVADEEGRVLGTLVLDGEEIVAVAVRRSRRGQGIGTPSKRPEGARTARLGRREAAVLGGGWGALEVFSSSISV